MTMSMDSHNHQYFWHKKTKLFSNTLHWCPHKILLHWASLSYLSCKHHISRTIFHILLRLYNHTFFKSAITLAAPPVSAVSKPPYNFWRNITSYVLSHFQTPSLPDATRKPWSCHSEGMWHVMVTARVHYFPRCWPGKDSGCSGVHSRNNTLLKPMIQEVLHLIWEVLQVMEGKEKALSFSAESFLEIILWSSA